MVTTIQHASPGHCGAVLGRNQKRGNRNESTEEVTVCFHTHIITQPPPRPLRSDLSSVFHLQLRSPHFPFRFSSRFPASVPNCSFCMKLHFLFSHPQRLTTLRLCLTPPSLCSHALWFFLFFCLLPPSVLLGMSRHAQEEGRERRGEREGGLVAQSYG